MPKLKHTSVNACAGTGKTWTMEQAFRHFAGEPLPKTGSDEQQAIWKSMGNFGPRIRAVMAFNRSVKEEWQAKKIPGLYSYTTFGFGLRVLQMNGLKAKGDPQPFKTDLMLEILEGKPTDNLNQANVINARRLVELARLTLTDDEDPEAIATLADDYGVNYTDQVLEWVPQLIALHAKHTDIIDFADMVWLPFKKRFKLNNPIDMLGVDEVQDLNAAQQALILSNARRFMIVGDRRQAIYQFAGADQFSFDNFEDFLNKSASGMNSLPMTITRRCSKEVVRYANSLVPELQAMPNAPEGSVSELTHDVFLDRHAPKLTHDDFVLCRRNAPLVELTLKLIMQRKPARMIGRDFGRSCLTFIRDVARGAQDTTVIRSMILEKIKQQEDYWQRKRFVLDRTKELFYDMTTSALVFCSMASTLDQITKTIEEIFLDDKQASDRQYIRCSSIHRAKGLEAKRVFFLEADRCGVPFTIVKNGKKVAVTPTQVDFNLRYVGITRAQEKLFMVSAKLEPNKPATEDDDY